MTTPGIGIVSCREFFERATDDARLVAEFQRRGHAAERVNWDDASCDWSRFGQLILRSPWDYSWRMSEFFHWMERMEAARIRVWNGAALVRWNSNKRYLRELEAQGVFIPPTEWIEPHAEFDLEEILARRSWTEAVLKPMIDAGGWNTMRIRAGATAAHPVYGNQDLRGRGLMVQEFIPEILDPGEYGLAFFNRSFSHAALKTPTGGEFRTQTQHGGAWSVPTVSADMIAQAEAMLDYIREPLLYGRVDGVWRGGRFMLMELELFEPWLFFEYTTGGEARFVKAFEELST